MGWATINVRTTDGTVANITVENEGHCEATGALLVGFYNSFDKAKELLKCGSLYQLKAKLPTKEFIDKVSKEVSTGDISNMPFYPYHFIDLPDFDNVIKSCKFMDSVRDYVICRFLVENITLPSHTIQNNAGQGNNKLVICSSNDERYKVQKGFKQGEYTYLFDQKENKWFLYGDNENEKYDLEDLLKSGKSKWTVEKFIKENDYYNKKLKRLVKKLQAEYQRRLKGNKRPTCTRELNNWINRQGAGDRFSIQTVRRQHAGKQIRVYQITSFKDYGLEAFVQYASPDGQITQNKKADQGQGQVVYQQIRIPKSFKFEREVEFQSPDINQIISQLAQYIAIDW